MKQTPLKRRTPLRAKKPIARGRSVAKLRAPSTPGAARRIRPVNPERRATSYDRNYGGPDGRHADYIRSLPCACRGRSSLPEHDCRGRTEAAHEDARAMGGCGGGWADIGPLCRVHHREAGERRTSQREAFEARYEISLRRVADEHARHYMSDLAKLWVAGALGPGYDREALFGWVRRFCEQADSSNIHHYLGPTLDLFVEGCATDDDIRATVALFDAAATEHGR